MVRHTSLAVLAALTVFGSSASLAAPSAYQFTELGTLGAPNGGAYGTWPHSVNNAGQVSGRGKTPTHNYTPFLWTNGEMVPLAPNQYGDASAMNNAGQVVGAVQPTTGEPQSAFLWTNGTLTMLPSSSYYESAAWAISNGGPQGVMITGFVRALPTSSAVVAIWQNSTLTTISSLDHAFGVNDQGQIVGSRRTGSITNAIRYTNGATTTVWTNGTAHDINNAGQIVGGRTVNGQASSVVYDNGALTVLASGNGVNTAMSINEAGDVVGRYQVVSTTDDHGYLWQDGQFYDLNDIASAGAGNVFATAEGINDQGQIVGLYRRSTGGYGGYLLTPIPEPAGLAGVAIAVASLARRRSRGGNESSSTTDSAR